MNGTHQCDFLNFCGGLGPQRCLCHSHKQLSAMTGAPVADLIMSTRCFFRPSAVHRKQRFPWELLSHSGYRSHFGSRYKLGCCGHAGLFPKAGSIPRRRALQAETCRGSTQFAAPCQHHSPHRRCKRNPTVKWSSSNIALKRAYWPQAAERKKGLRKS